MFLASVAICLLVQAASTLNSSHQLSKECQPIQTIQNQKVYAILWAVFSHLEGPANPCFDPFPAYSNLTFDKSPRLSWDFWSRTWFPQVKYHIPPRNTLEYSGSVAHLGKAMVEYWAQQDTALYNETLVILKELELQLGHVIKFRRKPTDMDQYKATLNFTCKNYMKQVLAHEESIYNDLGICDSLQSAVVTLEGLLMVH